MNYVLLQDPQHRPEFNTRRTNLIATAPSDTARFAHYFHAMLNRGVYLPCSQFEANFVSVAHEAEHMDATVAAAKEALAESAGP